MRCRVCRVVVEAGVDGYDLCDGCLQARLDKGTGRVVWEGHLNGKSLRGERPIALRLGNKVYSSEDIESWDILDVANEAKKLGFVHNLNSPFDLTRGRSRARQVVYFKKEEGE